MFRKSIQMSMNDVSMISSLVKKIRFDHLEKMGEKLMADLYFYIDFQDVIKNDQEQASWEKEKGYQPRGQIQWE